MTRLEIIIIVTGAVFVLFSLDLYQRKKFTLLHFLVFGGGTGAILFFILFPGVLDYFGSLFGLARGADLVVYLAIIFLGYGYIENVNSLTKQSNILTKIVTSHAVSGITFDDMTGAKHDIGFLIRAYNEEKTLVKVVDEIVESGYSLIVICNDGSEDATGDLIRGLQKRYSEQATIIGVHHEINRGPGAANKTLFSFASRFQQKLGVRWRITYDADHQMNIHDMKKFENYMTTEYDVILGSRHIDGARITGIPFFRKCLLRGSRIFTKITTGYLFTDPHNGYRAIHASVLPRVELLADSMTYASELLSEFIRLQVSIQEVPVHITYTQDSLEKGQKNSNAFRIVGELLYKRWFYK